MSMTGITGSVSHGQATVGATPQQLSTSGHLLRNGCVIKALAANAAKVYVGNSSSMTAATGYELTAGQSVVWPEKQLSNIYVMGTASDKVCWAGA